MAQGEYAIFCASYSLSLSIKPGIVEADITSNLNGWWKFDDGSGTTPVDSSGNGNNGSFVNGPPVWTDGIASSSLQFHGGSVRVRVADAASIQNIFDSGGSVSFWVYSTTTTSNMNMVGKNKLDGGLGWSAFLDSFSSGKWIFKFSQGWTSTGTFYARDDSSIYTVPNNQWNHIVVTYNSDSTSNVPSIYINGVSKTVITQLTPSGTRNSDASGYFQVGYVQNTALNGRIDDVRLYDRILTSGDVTELYDYGYAPTITTSAATSIGDNSAILNGSIDMSNAASSTVRGFAYGTSAILATVIATTTDTTGAPFGAGSFAADISSLTQGTTYYFRAYATNATTTGYGEILNFTTTQPDTVPGSPTGVSAVAGNQQATVSFSAPASDGGSTILYYPASSSPGNIAGYGSGSPITVTGLTNEVAYTFTVTATNAIGTSTPSTASNEVTPNTTDPPTVTTSATVDPIGQLSATLNGDITATGGQNATQHGFAYGTSATLVTVIATTTGGAFSGTGAFTSSSARSISSLSCGTTYYYRAYASNDYGTGYGTIQNFETLACAESVPTVIVLAYDTVTQTSANLLTFT